MMFNGFSEMSILVADLPVYYKKRDNLFFPAWVYSVPGTLTMIPYSLVGSSLPPAGYNMCKCLYVRGIFMCWNGMREADWQGDC